MKFSFFKKCSFILVAGTLASAPQAYAQNAMPSLPDFLKINQAAAEAQEKNSAPNAAAAQMQGSDIPAETDMSLEAPDQFIFEQSAQDQQAALREQAFESALKGLMPLEPEEVRRVLERYDRSVEIVKTPIYPRPKSLNVVKTVALDPGSEPLIVRTSMGHVTTLSFVDITGAPWPVQNMTWAGNFDIVNGEAEESGGTHYMRITPSEPFARGNVSIKMVGLQTPLIMIFEADRDQVHYRFDAVIPEYGPFAETPLIDGGITLAAGNSDISTFLQGTMPQGAEKLNVYGVDGRTSAYSYNGQTYLRTPLNLLSPAWSSSMTAADGTKIYELQNTPVVLLSNKGAMVRARITDREDP